MSCEPTILNFGAGPALLPEAVRAAIAEDIRDLDRTGIGLLEHGHRTAAFDAVMEAAEHAGRAAAGLTDEHVMLFLPGGATMQFGMVPLNFLPSGGVADHLHTGIWTGKAMADAARIGRVHLAWDGTATGFRRVPSNQEIDASPSAAYLHYCANNTVMGTQHPCPPAAVDGPTPPLIVDASSEILSRDPQLAAHSLIYAGGQKNLGPAGMSLVIARRSFIERASVAAGDRELPVMLDYRRHLAAASRLNTPPTFGIQLMRRMFEWILAAGGVAALAAANERKAAAIYDVIDGSGGFYVGHAEPGSRSRMNIVFRTPDEDHTARFLAAAADAGMVGLAGHRSVGGLRASMYNAFPASGATQLAEFMREFARQQG